MMSSASWLGVDCCMVCNIWGEMSGDYVYSFIRLNGILLTFKWYL